MMAQLLLFDVAAVCCLNCGEAIAALCDLRRNCSENGGNHEVTPSQAGAAIIDRTGDFD